MGEIEFHYQEGDYLIIKDAQAAKRTISMQSDAEADMVVRVEHNFGSFLVCSSSSETDVPGAKQFPPSALGRSDSVKIESEQKKYG